MKINKIDLKSMRNDAHFRFHTDFIALVNGAGAAGRTRGTGRGFRRRAF